MNTEQVIARSAIEALRSGVPSRHAVAELGTMQQEVKEQFDAALEAVSSGEPTRPILIEAGFGQGKSHVLNYLQSLAERNKFVTSYVVVSPEMPLGNAHIVLKAISEAAKAPGRTGKALRELTTDYKADSSSFAELRLWTRDANLNDRFPAMLQLYEEFWADEEFRAQVLDDFQGKPLLKTEISRRLKQIGQLAAYSLKGGPRNAVLAHDRIRLLSRFFRACGCKGFVVLFDEIERISQFTLKQRLTAYNELGWWRSVVCEPGSGIVPVFAFTTGFVEQTITNPQATYDESRVRQAGRLFADDREQQAEDGIDLLKGQVCSLRLPRDEEFEEIKYKVKQLYEQAYNQPVSLPETRSTLTSIRSEIRSWVTRWDLERLYPDYHPTVETEEVQFDTTEIPEDAMVEDEDEIGQ